MLNINIEISKKSVLSKEKTWIWNFQINWDPVEEGTSQCTRTVDEADAKEVARKLKIPFETVNFVKEYWNEVFVWVFLVAKSRFSNLWNGKIFRGMVENYRRGRTIVPDIACNRHIKFRHLHDFATKKLGAKFIATGHYATISRSRSGGDHFSFFTTSSEKKVFLKK